MADARNFPDVEFVDTDTAEIAEELIENYQEALGRKLHQADPEYMRLLWFASVISHERSYMNIAAKRNLPRYADGEYLDSLSEIFYDVDRQEAVAATTTLRFTLSEVYTEAMTIPAGTEVTVDGNVTFATDEDLEIPAGELTGDVAATCTETGSVGNGYAAGTVNSIIHQIGFVVSAENLYMTAGGSERETDDEYYIRLRESYEGFSTAGTAGAYRYWAMKHSETIADCVVTEGMPGWTIVTILMETGTPTEAEIQDMYEFLSSDDIRPLTDRVVVRGADPVEFSIDVSYYGPVRPSPGGKELEELVDEAVENYITWQTGTLGRDIDPGKLAALIYQAGAEWVRVSSPQEQELSATECAELSGDPIATYEGEWDT